MMKAWLLALVGIILTIWRWFVPSSKWVRKREENRLRLIGIEDALEKVTLKIVDAKRRGDIAAYAFLDIRREQLLKARRDCKSEYQYYTGLCDKER